jgi:hypothetical protein
LREKLRDRKEVRRMGVIKNEEIRGYQFYDGRFGEIVCLDCVTQEDLEDLQEDEILTEYDLEQGDFTYFCDRCKELV